MHPSHDTNTSTQLKRSAAELQGLQSKTGEGGEGGEGGDVSASAGRAGKLRGAHVEDSAREVIAGTASLDDQPSPAACSRRCRCPGCSTPIASAQELCSHTRDA